MFAQEWFVAFEHAFTIPWPAAVSRLGPTQCYGRLGHNHHWLCDVLYLVPCFVLGSIFLGAAIT